MTAHQFVTQLKILFDLLTAYGSPQAEAYAVDTTKKKMGAVWAQRFDDERKRVLYGHKCSIL